jgi:hypothetical protein
MQRQRPAARHSNSPNVVAASSYSVKLIDTIANVRAWYNRPCAAVPVQCQRLPGVAVGLRVAGGPNVVAAADCRMKDICEYAWVRARYHRPPAAIPMQDQRRVATIGLVPPHGPKIVAATGNCLKPTLVCAGVGARHHRPDAAIPMLGKRVYVEVVVVIDAHSPNVVAAACCSPQDVATRARIRTRYL